MRITPDTNVLVRAAVEDDAEQTGAARQRLEEAEIVVIAAPALCEFAWVLARGYRYTRGEIANAVRQLMRSEKVVADTAAVEAGLAMLDLGGDFADGAIAHEGVGRDSVFVSFDKRAVRLLGKRGVPAIQA